MNRIIAVAFVLVPAVLLIITAVIRRRPRKLKNNFFVAKWRELQAYCRERSEWPEALKAADELLDVALKKKRYKGKTMGARLMAAQREIADNDGIWFAHNLTKELKDAVKNNREYKLAKSEVREALMAYKNALMDLGAIKRG